MELFSHLSTTVIVFGLIALTGMRAGFSVAEKRVPLPDRRLLVELIVQTARRRVRDRATARPGMGRR